MNFDLITRSSACFLKDIHSKYRMIIGQKSCFQWNFKSISLLMRYDSIFVKLFRIQHSTRLLHDRLQMQKWWNFWPGQKEKIANPWTRVRQGGNSFNRQSGVRTQMRVIAATEITFLETHAELAWHTINQGETIQCTQSRNQLNQTFSLENSLSLGAIVTGPGAELSRTGLGWAGLALKWLDLFHCVGVKLTWLTRRSFGYHHHRQQTAAAGRLAGWLAGSAGEQVANGDGDGDGEEYAMTTIRNEM